MKEYEKVIACRYDKDRFNAKGINGNMYSSINPVGFYGDFKKQQILTNFISILNRGNALDKIKICDCGCGSGKITRFCAELIEDPARVYGVDYSKVRVDHCRKMNPFIHYEYADLTKEIPFSVPFDAITAFVVFMHFSTPKEIGDALKNIHRSLKSDGLFLWYDTNEKSHWNGGKRSFIAGHGFSANEMDTYASKAGFSLVKSYGVYSKLPIINRATLYLAERIKNIWLLELLEKLPFKKYNHVRIYRKE